MHTYFRLLKIFGLVFVVWIEFELKVKYFFHHSICRVRHFISNGCSIQYFIKKIFLWYAYINSIHMHQETVCEVLQCCCTVCYIPFSYQMRVRHRIVIVEYHHLNVLLLLIYTPSDQ